MQGTVKHIFSHQKWEIEVTIYEVQENYRIEELSDRELRWVEAPEFRKMPFSKVQTKLWEHVSGQLENNK